MKTKDFPEGFDEMTPEQQADVLEQMRGRLAVEELEQVTPLFKDAKGRTWVPHVTVRTVEMYEKLTGVGLFEVIFGLLQDVSAESNTGGGKKNRQGKNQGKQPANANAESGIFGMFGKLFGKTGHMVRFLYESCRDPDTFTVKDENDKEVEYEEFADAITGNEINAALACAIASIVDFMPMVEPGEEGGVGAGPFGAILSGIATKLPREQT